MSSLLVFNLVYRPEIQSVMLVFSIPLVNYRHSNLVAGSFTPLPPFPVGISTGDHVCTHTVCNGGRGSGAQTDKHMPPSTFTGQFLRKADNLRFGIFTDIWSMGNTHTEC